MNSWSFIGRIGRDGEVRFIPSGDAVLSFPVAVDSGYGQKKKTSWARVTVWGKRGESLAEYIIKGNQIGITGEVTLNEFTTKDGVKQQNLDVRASEVTLIKTGSPQAEAKKTVTEPDDDIPF